MSYALCAEEKSLGGGAVKGECGLGVLQCPNAIVQLEADEGAVKIERSPEVNEPLGIGSPVNCFNGLRINGLRRAIVTVRERRLSACLSKVVKKGSMTLQDLLRNTVLGRNEKA